MKIYKSLSLLLSALFIFAGCDLLVPKDDNHDTFDRVYDEPAYAEGLETIVTVIELVAV